MKKSILFILFLGMANAADINTIWAQFQIARSVIGNGSTTISNSEFQITGTVGQPAIGTGSTQNIIHQAGFWSGLDFITAVEPIPDVVPAVFRLDQNYPNPFNPVTTIQFSVPKTAQVSIKLYDILGREVATLLDERMTTGEYKLQFEAAGLASGLYFYRMQSEGFVQSRKLTLLK